mmetsp:Transcript_22410/g.49630  ORF Transcript_22410/g.49630 Transcript_22410/m.49630 type:complete len:81 (-) Transcript_22410:82-324(-)
MPRREQILMPALEVVKHDHLRAPGTRRGRTSQNGPSSEEDALCPTRSCIVTAFQPLWLPYREVASQPEVNSGGVLDMQHN